MLNFWTLKRLINIILCHKFTLKMMERSHLTPNTIQILLAVPKGAFQYTSHIKSPYSLGTCKTLLVLDFTFSLCVRVCVCVWEGGGGRGRDIPRILLAWQGPLSLVFVLPGCNTMPACLPATKSYWKPCKR